VAEAILESVGDGYYRVRGALTFETVSALLRASEPMFQGPEANLELDFGEVQRSDSAGLALLIEWLCNARAAGKSIRFHRVSAQMRAIAQVSDLEGILPI